MQAIKQAMLAVFTLIPALTMAHPGHHQHHATFWTGFIHPFTGLDHLIMAISFGVLMWTVSKQWKWIGALGLVTALVVGFSLGAQALIPSQLAEYGIIASLLLLAVALWTKSNRVLPIVATALATFHGVAHGADLGMNGNVAVQILGMISAMAIIYALGLTLGAVIARYVPNGKKIIGVIAAVVAVIGLA